MSTDAGMEMSVLLYPPVLVGGDAGMPIVAGEPESAAAAIFWYNALHLLIALVIGLIVIRLVDQAERHPSQALLVLFTIVAGFIV